MMVIRTRMRHAAVLATGLVAAACGGDAAGVCDQPQGPSFLIEVRDSASGRALARGTTGFVRTGPFEAPLAIRDTAHLIDDAPYPRPGSYTVVVLRAGYREWHRTDLLIDGQGCQTQPRHLLARLQPEEELRAEPQ